MEMVVYDQACRAVAEARTVDEVQKIIGVQEQIRTYARQAKNRQMMDDAMEIIVRAERRGGELLRSLIENGKVARQGVRDNTALGERNVPRLSEMGIDGMLSGRMQRVAAIPDFDCKIAEWRATASSSTRAVMPLQEYRRPSIRADRQKARHRRGSGFIDSNDPFDKFTTSDGRRVVDFRIGELQRLQNEALRVVHLVDAIFDQMPIANPDPLSTIELVFEQRPLRSIIESIWDAPVGLGDTGVTGDRIAVAREARANRYRRRCKHCGTEFIMRRPSGKAMAGLSNEGQFCCRAHMHAYRKKCGT